MRNRKEKEESLTFSRAQVYLILGSVFAIAVLSFVIGRLGGKDGGSVRKETAQMQSSLLTDSEVMEEMNRLEKRLAKAAEISPMEKPVSVKQHESDKENMELSFAEKLSGEAPDETEHEIRIKTIEKIERLTVVPPDKGLEIHLNKQRTMPVAKQPMADVRQPVAGTKQAMADTKQPVALKPPIAVFEASLKKPAQKIANPKYTIQIGSFPSEKSAKKLQIRLKNKGYTSYIKKVSRLRTVWYRVCVGAYEKRWEAKKILDRLKKKERMEGIILNYEK